MDLEARIAALKRRLQALEEQRSTLEAPVRVVDAEGRVLLSIDLDECGAPRLQMLGDAEGQSITVNPMMLQIGQAAEFAWFGECVGCLTVGGERTSCYFQIGEAGLGREASIGIYVRDPEKWSLPLIHMAAFPEGSGITLLISEEDGSNVRFYARQDDEPLGTMVLWRNRRAMSDRVIKHRPDLTIFHRPDAGGSLELRDAQGDVFVRVAGCLTGEED